MHFLITGLEKFMFPCLTRQIFGIDCPGCGAQRAFVLLLNGDFNHAFRMFPAIYTSVLFGIFISLHIFDRARNYQKPVISLAIINAVIMIVAYIYKMTNF